MSDLTAMGRGTVDSMTFVCSRDTAPRGFHVSHVSYRKSLCATECNAERERRKKRRAESEAGGKMRIDEFPSDRSGEGVSVS